MSSNDYISIIRNKEKKFVITHELGQLLSWWFVGGMAVAFVICAILSE